MLQRDYFIRLIEEFNAAVSRFLVKKEDDLKRDKELKDLLKYAGEQWKEDERTDRIGMLAELLYAEASYKGQPLRQMLQEKAYCLFDYVEAHDSTFSIERRQKMDAMRRELGEILPLAH